MRIRPFLPSAAATAALLLAAGNSAGARGKRAARPPAQTSAKAAAQREGKQRSQWDGQTLAELDKELNLTADQKSRLKPIIDALAVQIEAVNGDKRLSAKQKQASLQQVYSGGWAQIRPILTPRQQDILAQDQLTAFLASSLKLSEKLRSQVRGILRDEVTQVRPVQDDKTLSADDRRSQIVQLDDDAWARISAQLSADQKQTLDKVLQGQMVDWLSARLTLTAKQKAAITPALQATETQINAVRDDKTLASQDKAKQLGTLRDQLWSDISSHLTAEQKLKVPEVREESENRFVPSQSKV